MPTLIGEYFVNVEDTPVSFTFKRAGVAFDLTDIDEELTGNALKPDGETAISLTGQFTAAVGTAGVFAYAPELNEFDIDGRWYMQAVAVKDGLDYHSDWIPVLVGSVIWP